MTKFIDSGAAKLRIEEAATKKQVRCFLSSLLCTYIVVFKVCLRPKRARSGVDGVHGVEKNMYKYPRAIFDLTLLALLRGRRLFLEIVLSLLRSFAFHEVHVSSVFFCSSDR